MNAFPRTILLAGFLAISGPSFTHAAASTPYLETMPATFLWQFNVTGVGKARVAQPVDSSTPIENPDAINPLDRVTTETGAPITYSGGNGKQAFFVQQLLRKVLEGYAVDSVVLLSQAAEKQALAAQAVGTAAITYTNEANALIADAMLVEDNIKFLKLNLDDDWELTLARLPQTSAEGVLTSPYWVFLTKVDSLKTRTMRAFDTGLRLTQKYSAGPKVETLSSGNLAKATGTITTYFTLEFENIYANDPLYMVDVSTRGAAVNTENYNTAGSKWTAFGSGYMTYTLRSTAGSPVAVAPTKMKISAAGSWIHTLFNFSTEEFKTYAGTAPLGIKVGEVIYQRSEYFPEFDL